MSYNEEIFKFFTIFSCYLLLKLLVQLISLHVDNIILIYFSDPIDEY